MKLRKESVEATQNQNNSIMNQLVELQRGQQQQFMQLMRQQQERSSCMMVLLNKLTSQNSKMNVAMSVLPGNIYFYVALKPNKSRLI